MLLKTNNWHTDAARWILKNRLRMQPFALKILHAEILTTVTIQILSLQV